MKQNNSKLTYFTQPTQDLPVQLSGNSYTFIYHGYTKNGMMEVIQWKTYYDAKRLPPVPLFPRIVDAEK